MDSLSNTSVQIDRGYLWKCLTRPAPLFLYSIDEMLSDSIWTPFCDNLMMHNTRTCSSPLTLPCRCKQRPIQGGRQPWLISIVQVHNSHEFQWLTTVNHNTILVVSFSVIVRSEFQESPLISKRYIFRSKICDCPHSWYTMTDIRGKRTRLAVFFSLMRNVWRVQLWNETELHFYDQLILCIRDIIPNIVNSRWGV